MKEEMKENISLLLKKFNPGSQNMPHWSEFRHIPCLFIREAGKDNLGQQCAYPKQKKKRDSVSNKERN
jgi:hypothetical protein